MLPIVLLSFFKSQGITSYEFSVRKLNTYKMRWNRLRTFVLTFHFQNVCEDIEYLRQNSKK